MNIFCSIKTCGRSRRRNKAKMFVFPRANSLIGRIWREKCNTPAEIYHKRPHICERHFDKRDIGNKYLKRTAIPKYFLNEISVGNADGNDQAYDWKSLDEIPDEEKSEPEKKVEPPKQVIETVTKTIIVERCNNCDKKKELALCYEKKCNSLIIENYELQAQLEENSKLLEKTEHSRECLKTAKHETHYRLKCEKLSAERSEYKKQTEDLLSDSLRNLERSKYYEKKCDALKGKYEKIISQLEEQLKQQSEIQRNCLSECSNDPEMEKQIRSTNSRPESMPSSNLEEQSERASCMPEPMLSEITHLPDPELNADLITEPMPLDNQTNSGSSQNVVSETPREEIVETNEFQFIYLNDYAAPNTSSNEMNAIKGGDDYVECVLKKENEDEIDEIKESDSEIDFNFNYDDALMSPSSIKQEEEFILE